MRTSYIRKPATAAQPLTAGQVADAYHYPPNVTGKGYTVGIVELGGGFKQSDMAQAAQRLGISVPNIVVVNIAGGKNEPGQDADAEVLLDMQVVMEVAPGATQRLYFAPNTDQGFLEAFKQAVVDGCDAVSCSWGGPETSWDAAAMDEFDQVFQQARAAGIVVTCASGDSGADDGTSKPVTDFPASSPHVIACGGTQLTLAGTERSTEIAWDDNDRTSASGGGVSGHFLGRNVPDVSGNADPQSGYEIVINGQLGAVGGTSAVAPLYAGLVALLSEAVGARVGHQVDFMNTLLTNMGVLFDVTAGDNGAFRAGPGRDNVTGLGVVDGGKLLAVLQDTTADPAPFPGDPPEPDPEPVPTPDPVEPTPPVAPEPALTADERLAKAMRRWLTHKDL